MINNDMIEKDVYSTEEVKTNKIWIDGRPIYRKVYHMQITNDSGINIPCGITNMNTIINCYGCIARDNLFLPIPNPRYNYNATIEIYVDPNGIIVNTQSSRKDMYITIILEYIKTTD